MLSEKLQFKVQSTTIKSSFQANEMLFWYKGRI